ncbi:MAG: hypothetical protein HY204_07490 [Nitrospirae bacterium]|nr:hypothetical protein [Nitrospirota bacterium]
MMTRTVGLIVMTLALIDSTERSWALPQFGIQFGSELHEGHAHDELLKTLDCRACHVNPDGGGMRNEHGREFSIERLPLNDRTEDNEKAIEAARINPYISFGTDLRFAYLRAGQESASKYKDSFFPMQADLYIAFIPTDYFTLYYQDGVQASGSRETFLLIQRLPFNSDIKIGRFIPPYGLKVDDHTSFIREKLGFGPFGFGQVSGVEAGFAKSDWFGNAAVFNSPEGSTGSPTLGQDRHAKGASATGGIKTNRVWLAGSIYDNRPGTEKDDYVGGYGALRLGLFTVMGERDRLHVEDRTANGAKRTGSASYAELDFRPIRGINTKLKYDRYDPDRAVSKDELNRYTFGMDLYPYPFTEVILQYRINKETPEIRNDQTIVMAHFFF